MRRALILTCPAAVSGAVGIGHRPRRLTSSEYATDTLKLRYVCSHAVGEGGAFLPAKWPMPTMARKLIATILANSLMSCRLIVAKFL
jgi:hypothetical protein